MSLKKLSDRDLDEISSFLYNTISDFILERVSSKEIVDIEITVSAEYTDRLDVDITAELHLDELSDVDPRIVDEAVDAAYEALESFLEGYRE
ncbi:DUF3194 domain-containing protein [Methanothermobacter sp. KEPCO-1]|uniref:DUF3194 domain-containing protein n=1 Tax=Methanothermobacter sp. KEPCO-1 TaxID=2603820 RepID=UPI0011CBCCEB|nr:DUF3194 domain-containing protein [Methanothermobacter sp. KEPCO-1]QEF95124.1 DUF3194 domain-containing protein [Methanothermobacter sp. KEPCO-1]